jgi:1-deoxy-D-xylulose 5-phosphate reductoisomerase
VAVNAFLSEKISFMKMADVVEYTMETGRHSPSHDLALLDSSDCEAREMATEYINKL